MHQLQQMEMARIRVGAMRRQAEERRLRAKVKGSRARRRRGWFGRRRRDTGGVFVHPGTRAPSDWLMHRRDTDDEAA